MVEVFKVRQNAFYNEDESNMELLKSLQKDGKVFTLGAESVDFARNLELIARDPLVRIKFFGFSKPHQINEDISRLIDEDILAIIVSLAALGVYNIPSDNIHAQQIATKLESLYPHLVS